MTRPITAFVAAVSLAIVITALTMKDRQTPAVIDSIARGAAYITEASLGQFPTGKR
jgi:hypothetical protein